MSETWHLLEDPAGGAAWNMAVDEALLQTAGQRGWPLLRVYTWDKPSVSIGYFQKFPVQLAATHVIVRRPTGGGLVYHGEDTTITVVVPPGHALYRMSTAEAYCAVHKAIVAAFSLSCARVSDPAPAPDRRSPAPGNGRPAVATSAGSGDPRTAEVTLHAAPLASPRGQYECFQKPVQGDVVADGRKLAGGAQRRMKAGMLHQGSIAAKIVAGQLRAGFERTLSIVFQPYELTAEERALAERLAREKYATDAWNKRTS